MSCRRLLQGHSSSSKTSWSLSQNWEQCCQISFSSWKQSIQGTQQKVVGGLTQHFGMFIYERPYTVSPRVSLHLLPLMKLWLKIRRLGTLYHCSKGQWPCLGSLNTRNFTHDFFSPYNYLRTRWNGFENCVIWEWKWSVGDIHFTVFQIWKGEFWFLLLTSLWLKLLLHIII